MKIKLRLHPPAQYVVPHPYILDCILASTFFDVATALNDPDIFTVIDGLTLTFFK